MMLPPCFWPSGSKPPERTACADGPMLGLPSSLWPVELWPPELWPLASGSVGSGVVGIRVDRLLFLTVGPFDRRRGVVVGVPQDVAGHVEQRRRIGVVGR